MTSKIVKNLVEYTKNGDRLGFLELLKTRNSPLKSVSHNHPEANQNDLDARDVAVLIYSFAKLKILDDVYWNELEQLFWKNHMTMNSKDYTNCVWGFSKHVPSLAKQSIWNQLEHGIIDHINKLNARELSTIAYSFAYKGHKSPLLWEKIRLRAISNIEKMRPMDIMMIIWALSKANVNNETIWNMLESKILIKLNEFPIDMLCTIVYSMAKMNRNRKHIWFLFQTNIDSKLPELSTRNIANIIWSFAKVNQGDTKFWNILESYVYENIQKFNMIDMINSIWGLHHMGKLSKEALDNLAKYLLTQNKNGLKKMTDQDLFNLSWIFHHYHYFNNTIWDILIARFKEYLKNESNMSRFLFKSHICFYNLDKSLWESHGRRFYFDYLTNVYYRLCQEGQQNISLNELNNLIEIAYYFTYVKLYDAKFWDMVISLIKKLKKPIGLGNNVKSFAKLYFVIVNKCPDYLVEFENIMIHNEIEFYTKLFKVQDALLIILKSLKIYNGPSKVHDKILNQYKTWDYDHNHLKNLLLVYCKTMNEWKDIRIDYIKKMITPDIEEILKTNANEIKNVIFEEMLNVMEIKDDGNGEKDSGYGKGKEMLKMIIKKMLNSKEMSTINDNQYANQDVDESDDNELINEQQQQYQRDDFKQTLPHDDNNN